MGHRINESITGKAYHANRDRHKNYQRQSSSTHRKRYVQVGQANRKDGHEAVVGPGYNGSVNRNSIYRR